jgi:hypothetical protein
MLTEGELNSESAPGLVDIPNLWYIIAPHKAGERGLAMQKAALAAIARTCVAAACLMLVQSPGRADVVTRYLEPFPDIEQDPYQMYWNDITGTPYPQDFVDSFSYDNATVRIDYSSFDLYHFTGSLYATDLKPDFCYQMKLSAKSQARPTPMTPSTRLTRTTPATSTAATCSSTSSSLTRAARPR